MMRTQTITALKFLLVMTILTGILYPLVMTAIAQLCFRGNANGSLVMKDGKIIGSSLIGQKFDSAAYFWSRPSATGYNAVPSGASNYGPTSDTLKKQVAARRMAFAANNSLAGGITVPREMIFASGSGLDPHISPEGAMLQLERVSSARKFTGSQKLKLKQLITDQTEGPQYYLFGEPRVNVFQLNLALENIR